MKKRILTLILALTLLLATALPAHAAGEPEIYWFDFDLSSRVLGVDYRLDIAYPWYLQNLCDGNLLNFAGATFNAANNTVTLHDRERMLEADSADYDSISSVYSDGLAAISKKITDADGRERVLSGYADESGKVVIAPAYSSVNTFHGGYAVVSDKDDYFRYYLIDKNGSVVKDLPYDSVVYYSDEGVYQVMEHDSETWMYISGIMDTSGKMLIECGEYDSADLSQGFVKVKRDNKFGLADLKGKEIISPKFDSIENIDGDNDLVVFTQDGKFGVADLEDIVLIPAAYDYIKLKNGVILVNIGGNWGHDGKWGVVDRNGRELLPVQFESEKLLFEGLDIVSKGSDEGYKVVDVRGSTVFEGKDSISGGQYGLIVLNSAQVEGHDFSEDVIDHIYIKNTKGETVIQGLQNAVVSGKYVFVAKNDKVGYFVNPYYRDMTTASMPDVDNWAKPGVDWALSNGYALPRSSAVFGANYACHRWEVVSVIWQAVGSPEPKLAECPFTDVSADDEYYKAVMWAYENKIAAGLTDTTFGPDETVNRAQAVTFIHRAANLPASSGSNPFADVKSGEYYANAVIWASENRIAAGKSDTSFDPYGAVTRAEMLAFLYRWKNK